jgi:hypothetical protein
MSDDEDVTEREDEEEGVVKDGEKGLTHVRSKDGSEYDA